MAEMNMKKMFVIAVVFTITTGILSVPDLTAKAGMEPIVNDPSRMMEYVNSRKDVNIRFENGETLLHYAANRGYLDVVTVLLKRGANINARDKDGRTPLHEAMAYRRYDVSKYLIEKGADMAARNKEGEAPLISIVYMDDRMGAVDLVNFFIKHGFDMRKDGDAKLLNESIRRNRKEVAFILLENGIPYNDSTLFDAAAAGYEEIFAYLMAKGANPIQKDILRAAAGSGNVNIIKMLLQKGHIPAPDDIDFALYKGNPDAAAYLNLVLKEEKKIEVDLTKRCTLKPDQGPCKANFDAGYYDGNAKKCRLFSYGGCEGTVPFETVEACRAICEQ